jgi:DNA-binding transcriptional regulator YiaG
MSKIYIDCSEFKNGMAVVPSQTNLNNLSFSLTTKVGAPVLSKMLNSNYKKKPCKTFNENGFCPYGSRCSFKHSERSLKEIKLPFYYVNVHIKNIIEPTHKRLTIFESISNSNNIRKNNDLFQNNCIHSSSTSTSTISNEESGDEEVNEKKKKILNCCENALNDNDNNNIN